MSFEQMAYVGDNINKDFHAPRMLGMRGIYLRNEDGLYERDVNMGKLSFAKSFKRGNSRWVQVVKS